MPKTPKSRYADTKKPGATIDIDPSEVKRIDEAAKSGDGVSDITAPTTMGADKAAAAAVEAKPAPAANPEPVAKSPAADTAPQAKTGDTPPGAAASPAPKAQSAASPERETRSATPSAFATAKPSAGPVASASEAKRGGSALAGGLVGGLIVLALGAGLQAAGLWPNGSAGNSAAVTQLQEEVAALRSDLAAAGSSDEVGALTAQVEELRAASGTSDTELRLAALEEAIAAVNDAPDAEAALQEVEQQLASAGEATTANASRLDAIEQALQGIEGRLAELEEGGGTERVIAASALKSAIDRGTPFMTELETYAKLDPGAAEVAELRDFAAEGVATRAAIAQEADAAARAMMAASTPVDENAGLVDRLTASARSLVQVRPVGMAEGDDTAAIVARLEASVRDDDYERAILEYESLPPQVQEAGADFMATVRARHAADQLIDRALTGALEDA